ncbi:sulfurtransferase [Novacetimonas hansenii]|nr:sulfurtransferase [Novacetimonas hansenii]
MSRYDDIRKLAAEARSRIVEISPEEARVRIAQGVLVIDVRDEEEIRRNRPLPGALQFSRGRLEFLIGDAVSDRHSPLILYCAGGNRGAFAADSLRRLGYSQVYNLRGGLHAWRVEAGQTWIEPLLSEY